MSSSATAINVLWMRACKTFASSSHLSICAVRLISLPCLSGCCYLKYQIDQSYSIFQGASPRIGNCFHTRKSRRPKTFNKRYNKRMNNNVVNWFDLPTKDFDRAVTFYSVILGTPIEVSDHMGKKLGFFPMPLDQKGPGKIRV